MYWADLEKLDIGYITSVKIGIKTLIRKNKIAFKKTIHLRTETDRVLWSTKAMEFTVNWIIFSAVAIAVGTSIETRKWSPIFIFICCVLFSLFSSCHDVLMALTLCSFFRLNGPIQRMQLDSDWIYVNANRKRSFNFAFILNGFKFRQSNWPKSREFIQNRWKKIKYRHGVWMCVRRMRNQNEKNYLYFT